MPCEADEHGRKPAASWATSRHEFLTVISFAAQMRPRSLFCAGLLFVYRSLNSHSKGRVVSIRPNEGGPDNH